ncbi:carbon storage regulator CsrA [Ruminiclostridium sufflavum DSM 19573]|uniref:Translational regulator CsrA n=1 Tax=Ruminiclostridium sufflavum DSM 19573 TaxID=1121337 RepID=A0A318XNC6_9FIRM|nr:carbon storage regulator CsrA [Ruminiclostridium sufflavum]PYG89116.1 carbon storage regulator CsrA [Ruminiclostridium sufflavum DSM 19573]
MLVLSRKKDQAIMLGDNIELTIIEIQGDQVRIGINAPKSVTIYRKEIFVEIQEENRKAARSGMIQLDAILKNK